MARASPPPHSRGLQLSPQLHCCGFPFLDRQRQVGLVIGKGGSTIKELQNRTGCRIQIPSQTDPGTHPPTRCVTLTGVGEAPHNAKRDIEMMVRDDENRGRYGSSAGGGGGGGGGPPPHQQGYAPTGRYGGPPAPYGAPPQQGYYGAPPPQHQQPYQAAPYGHPPPQQYQPVPQYQPYGQPPPQQQVSRKSVGVAMCYDFFFVWYCP